MYSSRFRRITFIVALLMTTGASRVSTTLAADPTDFSQVNDILNGTRQMLRSDDLVFGYQGGRGLFLTSNSEILETSRKNLQTLTDGSDRYSQPAVVGARNVQYRVRRGGDARL